MDNWIKIRFLCTSLGFDVNLWLMAHWDKEAICVRKCVSERYFRRMRRLMSSRKRKIISGGKL